MSPEERAIAREARSARDKAIADWQAKNLAQLPARLERIGLSETSDLASARFAGIVGDYYSAWAASGGSADQFTGQLQEIRELVLREVGSLWEQRGGWFDRVCRWMIENGLTPMIAEWKSRARKLEIERLQNAPVSEPASTQPAQVDAPPTRETETQQERARRRQNIVKPALTGKGLSVYRWERMAGVSSKVGQRYLNGESARLSPDTARKLSGALGIELPA